MSIKQSAHNQLNQCCQTLCNKKPVLDYIKSLEDRLRLFDEIEKRLEALELSDSESESLIEDMIKPLAEIIHYKGLDV